MSRPVPRAFVFVLAVLPLAGLAAAAFAHARSGQIDDYDELWHLAAGRVIAETGSVPAVDPFTFTAGETPWINTNWLAQVVLWTLYRAGGLELDWLLGIALLLGATALAHALAARRAPARATLPVTALVFFSLKTGSTVR